jgi:non-heme chloroperoxidase
MPYLDTRDGARLHYYDLGRGTPVVLLHGFAMPGALWLPFAAPLLHRYRFIVPDLRGFGFSHRVPLSQPRLLDQHADDLDDLLTQLDLQQVRLGGLSMGACTALQYHSRYGFARVHSYLHMDQAPCVRNGADWSHGLLGAQQTARMGEWQQLMETLRPYRQQPLHAVPAPLRQRLWRTLAEFFSHAFHGRGWQRFTALAQRESLIRHIAPTANWSIYMDCLQSYLQDDYDWRATLPAIDKPMTVLIGMQSTMYPAAGQLQIAHHVPKARMVRIDNCGHAIPFEAPRRFNRELRRFLAAA